MGWKLSLENYSWRCYMKTMFSICFGVLLASFMAAFALNLAGAETILVGTDPSFPPFEKKDAANQIVGFDVDLMKAVAQAGGDKVEFRETPFDRLFIDLAGRRIDAAMSTISILDERRALADFSEPYFSSSVVLLARAGSPTIRTTRDLAGRQVGTQAGVALWAKVIKDLAAKEKVTPAYFNELADGLNALLQGRVAGFIYDGTYAKYSLLTDPTYAGKLVIVQPALAADKLGIAVRRGNSTLLRKIDAGLKKIRENGRQKEIEARWLP
jgi:polar amino acid transport system substrate-binding protein